MIEIFYIISQILFISIILILPIFLIDKNYFSKSLRFNFVDKMSINIIFFINILFLASVFNLELIYILIGYLFLIMVLLLINSKNVNLRKIKFDYLFLLLLLFTFLISIDIADQIYFGWDAKTNWIFKALNFYQGQKIENLSQLNNSDYPHLGSFLWAFFWKLPYGTYEYLGRIFFAFIYVLSIFSFSNCLKAEGFEKVIFSILIISLTYSYDIFSGLQDVLIFSSILFFARISYLIFDKKNKLEDFVIFLILISIINMLCWFKNEGVFYSIFLLISLLVNYKSSKNFKLYLIFGSFFVFLVRIVLFNYYDISLNPSYFEMEKTLFLDIALIFYKLKTITFYIIIYSTQNPIFIITLPILAYLIFKYPIQKLTSFILCFFIFNLIFIYSTYIFKMTEVELLIKASLSRVIFQTSGFYLLIIIFYINQYMRISKK